MNTKKKIAALALICLVLLVCIFSLGWLITHCHIIDFHTYPRDAQVLDIRDREVTVSHYRKLRQALPDCEILWNVPVQGRSQPCDSRELTLTGITQEDIQVLDCFPLLEVLTVQDCNDYPLLRELMQAFPALQVRYTVTVGGQTYPQDARQLRIDGITQEELALVEYLPELEEVCLTSGKDAPQLIQLAQYCQSKDISLQVLLGGALYGADESQLTVHGITDGDIQLLTLLPKLQSLTLTEPKAAPDSLIALTAAYPEADIRWEKSVLGTVYSSDCREMDLSAVLSAAGAEAFAQAKTDPIMGTRDETVYQFKVSSKYPLPDLTGQTDSVLAQLEQELAYFPDLETVVLCCGIWDNETMSAFRDAHRQDYKVVWSIQLGNKLVARTDTPYLMPTKYHVYYFLDDDAVNLKYCEDLVCIDLGHMAIRNIDWITNMPNLTYLVLAHTQLQYIEPLRTCKNLKFLELDWSPIRDFSPLTGCTSLEDLNIGNTFADVTPIGEMTWLKNLWMIGCSEGYGYRMTQALPDTTVMLSGNATVASGWRTLPNYYAMRDALNMFDMVW